MGEASIPVDLFNPGQVFACLGFAEAVEVLAGKSAAAFDWSEADAERFWLRAPALLPRSIQHNVRSGFIRAWKATTTFRFPRIFKKKANGYSPA